MDQTKRRWVHTLALIVVLLIALFFRTYNISTVGFGNLYYAATVFSMLTSPANFFFGSFDPAGFVTVDKPPFGFWVQTLSTAVFGFKGWALLLPQIIAGVLSCLVLYWIVRRYYKINAGILAALILAVTPISVATDRNNTVDALLILVLLLSAGMLMFAVEKGSLKWLLAAGALIGIGFNIKMLQAFMILPAFYGLYFLAANTTWFKKITHLCLATLVLLIVSFSWAVTVDIIPAANRPYIGSSQENSVIELITGHNGVKRLGPIAGMLGLKQEGGPNPNSRQNFSPNGSAPQLPSGTPPLNQNRPQPQDNFPDSNRQQPLQNPGFIPQNKDRQNNQPPQGPGMPMGNETGAIGILRLFNEQLLGQVSWLLPLALVMAGGLTFRQKLTWPINRGTQFTLFWGLWLVPMVIFFSYAGLFHRYYLEMLAPAVAGLAAAGLVSLTQDFIERRPIGWLLPVSILASATFEVAMAAVYWPGWAGWAVFLTAVFGALSGLGLIAVRILPSIFRKGTLPLTLLGGTALLLIPILWATTPLKTDDVMLPYAGPELIRQGQGADLQNRTTYEPAQPRARNNLEEMTELSAYLTAHTNGETFIAAGMRASDVAPLILQTGQAAMAIGGFSGSDPILKLDEFITYITSGQLRFVLTGSSGPNGNNKQDITHWVVNHCKLVPEAEWSGSNPPMNQTAIPNRPGERQSLYDCK